MQDEFLLKAQIDYDNHRLTAYDPEAFYILKQSIVTYYAYVGTYYFEKGWKHGHPNIINKYGYRGPYKTEIECRQELSRLNKIKKQSV